MSSRAPKPNPRRHRLLFVLGFAAALVAAQALLGRAPSRGSLCGLGTCLAPTPAP